MVFSIILVFCEWENPAPRDHFAKGKKKMIRQKNKTIAVRIENSILCVSQVEVARAGNVVRSLLRRGPPLVFLPYVNINEVICAFEKKRSSIQSPWFMYLIGPKPVKDTHSACDIRTFLGDGRTLYSITTHHFYNYGYSHFASHY